MSSIRTSVGLISGLNFGELTDALISLQRASVKRLETRVQQFQSVNSGLQALSANLLPLTTAAQTFADKSTFEALSVNNPKPELLGVTTTKGAAPGTYSLQSLRKASSHQLISSGFANSDQQAVGEGTLTIATGGRLNPSSLLEVLNDGQGVRHGKIRITDRAGQSAEVDLTAAITVDDVLQAINSATGISVNASTQDGRIVLTDTSSSTASDLAVINVGTGHAADDLGLLQSVSAGTLVGETIHEVTGQSSLDRINDGNAIRLLTGAPDIRVTLSNNSVIEVNLDGAFTIDDVLQKINNHADNQGKLSASISNGRISLTDLTGGSATAFSVEDTNGTSVVRQLGLDVAATGDTISGNRLAAGLNSVLLRNLRGGQGIDQRGSITLTDRTGATAVLDLSNAESLDEVISAINAAQTGGGTKLQLTARINNAHTGIEVLDTSGASSSNLVIADLGGSTLAQQLGIAVDADQSTVNSGTLGLRYVDEGTSVSTYGRDGGSIKTGSFRIVDSAGNQAVINITTAVKNIGDVLQRINAAANIDVTAKLNDTGDGFVIVDDAGGENTVRVEEVSGNTAASLRILGEGTPGEDGKSRVTSRSAIVIEIDADDTLNDVVEKVNAAGGSVTASVFDDHSAVNSKRLSLVSKTTGAASELLIEDSGLDLGLSTFVAASDALLRIGSNPETAFLVTSKTNEFNNTVGGLNVTIKDVAQTPVSVTVSRNAAPIRSAITSLVNGYNSYVSAVAELTKFDTTTNKRGVLQGDGVVLRISDRLSRLVTRTTGSPGDAIRSLVDLGVRLGEGGKLVINDETLTAALNSNPEAVSNFFLNSDNGFAKQLDETLDAFTDPISGSLTLESKSLQQSVETLNGRITQLDALLEGRRERLLRQFSNLESLLGDLSSQQEALTGVRRLEINPAGRGVKTS